MKREEAENTVADPGRIVAKPTFRPRSPKNPFHFSVDPKGDEDRKAEYQDNPGAVFWTPPHSRCPGENYKDQKRDPTNRLGRSCHKAKGANRKRMSVIED